MSGREDHVLEQEKLAIGQIENANKEKDDLLRKAKEAARKETASYDDEKRRECMEKVTELASNTEMIEEIEEKSKKDIEAINKIYEHNKDKVIDYLFNSVIKVDFEVPDVVKGCFEEKFGIKE